MHLFLSVLHVMACLVLVVVVLLQRGKGADMGAMLGGGGANTVFGSRGAGNFLTRVTTACAAIFMITSLSLSYLTNIGEGDLIFDDEVIEGEAPAGVLEEIPTTESPAAGSAPEASTGGLEEIPATPPAEAPADASAGGSGMP